MAILSKIRDRSVALIAVVGLALFAFVLDPSTLTDFFSSSKINEVGAVNGESISRQEYAEAVESYRTRTQNRFTEMESTQRVWNDLLREKIYTEQLEKSGVTIGETDVWQRLITMPSVTNQSIFLNEIGLFDEDKLKQFLKDSQANDPNTYNAWINFMGQIKLQILNETYNNLINAGLGTSLKEGELKYKEDNRSFDASYVYIPYSSVPDSLVTVSKSEIERYVDTHQKLFKVDASRDIQYVKFDIKASEKDKEDIQNSLRSLLEDKKEFNRVSKQEETILGLKNTSDYEDFFDINDSDIDYNNQFQLKSQLPKSIAENVIKANIGEVFGPYEDNNMFKLSKVVATANMPDSVKSSHILIPFIGSRSAGEEAKTEEAAKNTADSIYNLVRRDKKKFAKIADEINTDVSKGKGGDIGWTTFKTAYSPSFDADFADYIFNNPKGDIGVVKTVFGYQVIRIDDVKNKQKVIKLATFGKDIVASQATETAVFQKAEAFALEVSKKDSSFTEIAKNKKYISRPAIGLKILDERIPGLGSNREIVKWSFNKDINEGDFKRFDVDGGYVVATLTGKTKEGLKSAEKATVTVKPILINEKKQEILSKKFSSNSLEEIAKANNNTAIKTVKGVKLESPFITGVGLEPKLVGAMYSASQGKLYKAVVGKKGVFAFVVDNIEEPAELPNYDTYRNTILHERRRSEIKVFEALRGLSNIVDNRATFYGVNQ